jgi:hypothetical protein
VVAQSSGGNRRGSVAERLGFRGGKRGWHGHGAVTLHLSKVIEHHEGQSGASRQILASRLVDGVAKSESGLPATSPSDRLTPIGKSPVCSGPHRRARFGSWYPSFNCHLVHLPRQMSPVTFAYYCSGHGGWHWFLISCEDELTIA